MGYMIVTVSNNILVRDPTPELTRWMNENLILPNPEYVKKARMGFWVGNTPQTLSLFEVHGKEWVLPFGVLRTIMPMLKGSQITTAFQETPEIDYGEAVPLYDYQAEAVDAMVKAKYGMLQSAAGSGKTQMGIAIIKRWKSPALWLCHTADLLNQSKERAERYMDKSMLGTITEGKVHLGSGVTFATVQTMCNLDLARYRHYWNVIIVDEAHRVSGSPSQMTRYFKVLDSLSAKHKYGLTATPDRSDGLIKATRALLGDVVYIVPDDAVADKIMKVGIKPVATQVGLSEECMNPDGTLNYTGMISYLCEDFRRTEIIASQIIAEADHSCLILSDRLEHLESLMNRLPPDMRKKAVMITGKMTSKKGKAEREEAIEQMRKGEKKYLFATYSLAREGLDIPRLDRLFLTTPVKYHATVIQSIGRIARTFPGKEPPITYDFIDNGIGYCVKAWKERMKHYRKAGAYLCERPTE